MASLVKLTGAEIMGIPVRDVVLDGLRSNPNVNGISRQKRPKGKSLFFASFPFESF